MAPEFEGPARRTRRVNIVLAVVIGAAAVLVAIGLARAAEPASRPHVITVHFAGKDYDHVSRTHLVLGNPPVTYASRETCAVAITRVRVAVSGARLVCTPAETGRVR